MLLFVGYLIIKHYTIIDYWNIGQDVMLFFYIHVISLICRRREEDEEVRKTV